MNNFIINAKRFLKNKNTVTIMGVLVIVLILFFGYRYQIDKAVSPVSNIPVAAVEIQPRTLITEDMLDYISVAPIVLQSNVIKTKASIVGQYSNYNTLIPSGSLFYEGVVVDKEDLPDAAYVELEEDEVPYNFPVSISTTYGNSIYPTNYIDIYMKAINEDGMLMVGKLMEDIEVLAVKDSAGRNVFENTSESRTPAYLIFGLSEEYNILLRKASYLSSYSVELFPVPNGAQADLEDATVVSSETLQNFINANTVQNDELIDESEEQVVIEETVTE